MIRTWHRYKWTTFFWVASAVLTISFGTLNSGALTVLILASFLTGAYFLPMENED